MLVRRHRRGTARPRRRYATKGADKFVAEGRYDEAGRLAMISNNWEEAIDLYRLADQPELAAAAARRAGQLLVAAELYDMAGDAPSAARCREAHETLSSFPPKPLPGEGSEAPDEHPSDKATVPKAPALPSLDPPSAPTAVPPSRASRPELSLPSSGTAPSAPPALPAASGSSVPPMRVLGSKPPEDSSYTFISDAPADEPSAPPPREHSEPPSVGRRLRAQQSTKPLGTTNEPMLDPAEVDALTAELQATGSLERPRDLRQLLRVAPKVNIEARRQRWLGPGPTAHGLETSEVDTSLLCDADVQAARIGDSVETLMQFVKGQTCDLGNIEVFHRIAMAYLAEGLWEPAMHALQEVDEVSPGYRGSDARVEALRRWRDAHAAYRDGFGEGAVFALLGEVDRDPRRVAYRAKPLHRDDLPHVALTVLGPRLEDDDAWMAVESELAGAASLNHPDILHVHEHGRCQDRAWMSSELLVGVPLDEVLDAMTVVEKLEALLIVLEALEYAHEGEVTHGDISPTRILLRPTGRAVLTGFGWSRATAAGGGPFTAPELKGERPMDDVTRDIRGDVFSVGATAYAVLSGQVPFEEGTHDVRPMVDFVDVPRVVDDAVLKALNIDPGRRWPSAAAFARALASVVDEAVQRDR
jgi:hypothetical protein